MGRNGRQFTHSDTKFHRPSGAAASAQPSRELWEEYGDSHDVPETNGSVGGTPRRLDWTIGTHRSVGTPSFAGTPLEFDLPADPQGLVPGRTDASHRTPRATSTRGTPGQPTQHAVGSGAPRSSARIISGSRSPLLETGNQGSRVASTPSGRKLSLQSPAPAAVHTPSQPRLSVPVNMTDSLSTFKSPKDSYSAKHAAVEQAVLMVARADLTAVTSQLTAAKSELSSAQKAARRERDRIAQEQAFADEQAARERSQQQNLLKVWATVVSSASKLMYNVFGELSCLAGTALASDTRQDAQIQEVSFCSYACS